MSNINLAIEVLESIASTIEGGVFRIVSHTPINPLLLDDTALALLEQQAGTTLTPIVNDLGETIGYTAKAMANAGNGASAEISTMVTAIVEDVEVTAEMAAETWIDASTGEVAQLTAGETVSTLGASATSATGASAGASAGLLTMEVGAAGAAIAPALGLLAGVGLYNIAPDFWTSVSDKLMAAGKTIGGKVKGIFTSDGKTAFDKETIEIFKEALIDAGYFDAETNFPPIDADANFQYTETDFGDISKDIYNQLKPVKIPVMGYASAVNYEATVTRIRFVKNGVVSWVPVSTAYQMATKDSNGAITAYGVYELTYEQYNQYKDADQAMLYGSNDNEQMQGGGANVHLTIYQGITKYYAAFQVQVGLQPGGDGARQKIYSYYNKFAVTIAASFSLLIYTIFSMFEGIESRPNVQDGATIPQKGVPFTDNYPDWDEDTSFQDEDYYPTSLPTDDSEQEGSQTGDNSKPEQEDGLDELIYTPSINIDPSPERDPDPDPDEDPEPDPDDDPIDPPPNPPDPNPPIPPSPVPVVVPVLDSTHADAMFTVYNPTDGQINSLGAFLWTDSIIEQIKKMWEDPMQAIISLHKCYAAPVTGGTRNIVLGYIDSGVSSAVVTQQFNTIDCGTITISERLHNATDYSPFSKAMMYLPFVGFVDIDITDIMGSAVNVQYTVDQYTGTCLAQVFCTRATDMTGKQLLYAFSGNAAQQLPLTGSNFSGAVSALLGLAGAGIAVASGGAGLAIGAVGAAHSLTQEMVQMQHSGGLSANAGIMGPRKPFIIIARQNGYDANGYNAMYGYPSNKTVGLGNCRGFVKVKAINYKGNATDDEKTEIINQLKEGVIL